MPGSPPPLKQARSAQTHAQILAAAQASLAKRGYHKTTIDELSRALSVSKGAIQYHFPERTDLFAILFSNLAQASIDRFLGHARAPGDPKRALRAAIADILDQAGGDEAVAMIEIGMAARSDEELAAKLKPISFGYAIKINEAWLELAGAAKIGEATLLALRTLVRFATRGTTVNSMLARGRRDLIPEDGYRARLDQMIDRELFGPNAHL